MESGSVECGCCSCNCARFASHCWFFFACCGFLIISSLPRILTLADISLSIVLYIFAIKQDEHSVWESVRADFHRPNFRTSGSFVIVLDIVRSFLLFFVFAYRWHLYRATFWLSTCIMVISAIFLTCKIAINTNDNLNLLLGFSLLITLVEYGVYMTVRRRRIAAPGAHEEPLPTMNQLKSSLKNLGRTHPAYAATHGRHPHQEAGYSLLLAQSTPHTPEEVKIDLTPPVSDAVAEPPGPGSDGDSQFIVIHTVKVHFKLKTKPVEGPNRRILVLLHGFGGSVFSWSRSWNGLFDLCDVLLAFDRPGFGLTSRPLPDALGRYPTYVDEDERTFTQENPYTMDYAIKLTLLLMEHLHLNPARTIFVGHSTGAEVALRLSLTVPVRGLLLISPTIWTEGFPALIRSMFRTKLGKSIVRELVRSEVGEVAIRRAWHDTIPDDVLANYKSLLQVPNWHEALMEMAQVGSAKDSEHTYLAQISVPVTIIHGQEDKLVPFSESQRALKLLQARLVPLVHMGHVPHEERPVEFIAEVREFLQQMDSMSEERSSAMDDARRDRVSLNS